MNRRKLKRYIQEAVLLIVIFIAASTAFGYYTNRDKGSMTADMDAATYPQVSFSSNGYSVNCVPGYGQEMETGSLRDTITPVANGKIEVQIKPYDNEISSMQCRIFTLDGKEKLLEAEVESPGESVAVAMQDPSVIAQERVLEIVLKLSQGKSVYYYTRIVDEKDKHVLEYLNYIKDFHENSLIKAEGVGIGTAIEPDETGDNSTLQHVTIHSDYEHVTWGDLEPQAEGSERWLIKEINDTSCSVQLQYQVRSKGEENEEDRYKVREFFRIRYREDNKRVLLLDYDRTMEQIFDVTKKVLNEKGLLLGIARPDTQYMDNEEGDRVAFVQADELWYYNKEADELSLIFSFNSGEGKDERNLTGQHKIRLLDMDKQGNLSFAVYGYMNRGEHEGEVGVAVYYYDITENNVEEKAFISTKKSYGHVILELGQLICYSVKQDTMYVLADGTLYQIELGKGRMFELAHNLKEGQYVMSGDGTRMAYQSGDKENMAGEATVITFDSGKKQTIRCEDDRSIVPLGFMDTDFVYGLTRPEDEGVTLSGESITPMYRIEIQSSKGKVVKTYENEGAYILSTQFDGNMITLNRVSRSKGVYNPIIEEYITNNEGQEESNISLGSYTTSLKQRQMRIVFGNGIENREPKILMPKQALYEKPREFSFDEEQKEEHYLVYGHGELQGIFEKAGEAIRKADEYNGVVVSADQEYVWERGNRKLRYTISEKNVLIDKMRKQLNAGTAPLEVISQINNRPGLDLTGCTAEELLYVINQDKPVIAMRDTDKAIILVGYTETRVTFIDVADGGRHTATLKELEEMTEKSGHTYIA